MKKLLTPDLGRALSRQRLLRYFSSTPLPVSSRHNRLGAGKRFGNLKNGAADIKEHKWFKALLHRMSGLASFVAISCKQDLSWDDLLAKKIEAPFKPVAWFAAFLLGI